MRSAPLGVVVLWALALLLSGGQAWRYPVTLDDAYITFRHGRNLARGDGLTFDPAQDVLATTAPGLAVILAGFMEAGLDPVTAGRLVSVLGLMLSMGGLILLGRHWQRPVAGLAAGVIICFIPDLVRAWGNECPILIGLFVIGWLMLEFRRPVFCAIAMVIGCMVRPDFAMAALLFAPFWWRQTRRLFLIYTGVGLGCSFLWLAILYWLDVSPIPHTLAVKRLQGLWIATGDPRAFEGWISFGRGLCWFLRRTVFDPPVGIFVLIGAILMIRLPRLYPLILWGVLHIGAYWLLGVPGHYYWYYYPLWLGIALAMGESIALLGDAVSNVQWVEYKAGWAKVSITLGLTLFCGFYYMGHCRESSDLEKSRAYQSMAELIHQNVRADQSVMMNEVGEMGFLADCQVVDTHGLIHPDMPVEMLNNIPAIVARYMPDFIVLEGWLDHSEPDYRTHVLAGDYCLRFPLGDDRFSVEYREIGHGGEFGHYLPVLLARDPGDALPDAVASSRRVEHSPEN